MRGVWLHLLSYPCQVFTHSGNVHNCHQQRVNWKEKNNWDFSCFSLFLLHWFVLRHIEQFYIAVLPADLKQAGGSSGLEMNNNSSSSILGINRIVAQTELTTEKKSKIPLFMPLWQWEVPKLLLTSLTEYTNKWSHNLPSAQGRFWQPNNTFFHEFSNFLSE